MSSRLCAEQHLDGLRAAMTALVRYADRAGLAAPVPTLPGSTLRDVVAHQGAVHRWCTGVLRGEPVAEAEARAAGLAAGDPLEWLRDGALAVAREIAATTVPARATWARRQCHDTTIAAVDAWAAAHGRRPGPPDTPGLGWLTREVAADGIDEVLGAPAGRRLSRLRCREESLLVVAPVDLDDRWAVRVGPHPPLATRRAGAVWRDAEADRAVRGTAADLYLQLWDRQPPPGPGDHGLRPGG